MNSIHFETENPNDICTVSTDLDHVVVEMGNHEIEIIRSITGAVYTVHRKLDDSFIEECSDATSVGSGGDYSFIEEYDGSDTEEWIFDDFYDDWNDVNERHAWYLECHSRMLALYEEIEDVLDDGYMESINVQEQLMKEVFAMNKAINK